MWRIGEDGGKKGGGWGVGDGTEVEKTEMKEVEIVKEGGGGWGPQVLELFPSLLSLSLLRLSFPCSSDAYLPPQRE